MQILSTRRQFFGTLGSAMGIVALGLPAAGRTSFARLLGARDGERLRFGALDPLVDLIQGTKADALLGELVPKLRAGLSLSDLVAASGLANARALGGTNYDGYHALMALLPSHGMAARLEGPLAPLPVLKVVHRNARVIQDAGKARDDTLAPLATADAPADLVERMRAGDREGAERALAAQAQESPLAAFERVQEVVRQDADVHRVVLSWRAWDLLRLAGDENAATLLRQELWFCDLAARSRAQRGVGEPEIAALVPELLERHGLAAAERGTRPADDAWIEGLAARVFASERADAAEAVARALAEGYDHADVGRALALAATRIVLHDRGQSQDAPGKPKGSVHGANHGVHASDSANAWRHIAAVGSARNGHATLIASAYHTAGHAPQLMPEPFDAEATPFDEQDPALLLHALDEAIQNRDQAGACAAARRYTALARDAAPLLALLLDVMIEEDGALHAEKYFQTQAEEHEHARPAHRAEHLVALTRVAASGYGFPAPGLDEAKALLAG